VEVPSAEVPSAVLALNTESVEAPDVVETTVQSAEVPSAAEIVEVPSAAESAEVLDAAVPILNMESAEVPSAEVPSAAETVEVPAAVETMEVPVLSMEVPEVATVPLNTELAK